MKAHQRVVREEREQNAAQENLLGNWWEEIDTDIKKAEVKPISLVMAKSIIEEYEWMGCLAAVNWFQFGIFYEGVCAGCVVYGPDYIENLGKWDKYDYTGKIILLSRGACVHWAHPHSASKLIRVSMKMLPERFKVVTATTDDLAGEIGTIYQACGFDYIGSMRDANPNVNSSKGDRDAWLINGKLYGSRAMRMKVGSCKKEEISKYFPTAEKVKQNSKGRYFAFIGNKKDKKINRSAISHLIKQYPKRSAA